MTDVIDAALAGAKAALDIQERAWVIGVAHLVDIPEIREFSEGETQLIIDLARELADFPSGPVGYLPFDLEQELEEDYRLITLTHPSAPHVEMKIGLGIAGFVAVGLTRGGYLGSADLVPSGLLVSDVESVMADVYTLTMTAAVHLGYLGPIDMAFVVSEEGPGAAPVFYVVDEASGAPTPAHALEVPLDVVTHRTELTPETTAPDILNDLAALAARFTATVGSDPQLVEARFAGEIGGPLDPIRVAQQRKAARD